MTELIRDVRYALRALRRSPAFTLVAVVTLALGIGANTAIFGMVNSVLWRPLPYAEPERIVVVGGTHPTRPGDLMNVSYPDYVEMREQTQTLESFAIWDWDPYNLRAEGPAVFVGGARVSSDYFDVLGVRPLLGRTFLPEEDRPGGSDVIVLSEGLWREQFGAAPDVLGQTVVLDGVSRTVIGVLPEAAEFPDRTRLWIPIALTEERSPRGMNWLGALGRLAGDATLEEARAEMRGIAARLQSEYPVTNRERGLEVVPLQSELVGDVRPLFLLLLGAVGFVLLIVCANVANLLLARAATREREIAIRAALGAGRARLVRQVLTESALLAAAGGALGYLLAEWGGDALVALVPVEIPPWIQLGADVRVLAFLFGITTFAVLLFGLAPALQVSAGHVEASLKEAPARATEGRGRNRLRSALVVSEVALSLVLLIGAGLMIRSLLRLSDVEPGFATEGRMMATIALAPEKYRTDDARIDFHHRVLERLQALPGIEGAGIVARFPLRGSSNSSAFTAEGQTQEEFEANPFVLRNAASPDYFHVAGIPLLEGRVFTDADRESSPPVAVVNDLMAKRYWPGQSAIGKRVKFAPPTHDATWIEIVGVVGSVHHLALEEPPGIQLYQPFEQNASTRMSLVLHTASAPGGFVDAVRGAVQAVDLNQALYDMMTLQQVVDESIWQWEFFTLLFWVFAGLAVVLAAVGLYGVVSYAVSQRTREIGIRMALGAGRGEVRAMVVRQGLGLVAIGVAVGLALGLAVSRLMSGVLYGVSALDPVNLTGVSALLAMVAWLACYVPARRATRVDPLIALRHE